MLTITHKPTNKTKKKKSESESKSERRRRRYLEESGGIGNVISHSALRSDSNLVLVYWCLRLWLLHSLVPIHLFLSLFHNNNNKQNNKSKTPSHSLTHSLFTFCFSKQEYENRKSKQKTKLGLGLEKETKITCVCVFCSEREREIGFLGFGRVLWFFWLILNFTEREVRVGWESF